MSSKIDERVVQMKFNSGEFQKGVADTSNALDKLKAALKLDGATKGLVDLGAAGKNVSLSGLADGVTDASSRFSGLQVIALGALATIGAKAIEIGQNLGQNLVGNLTSAMRDGFSDYNTKLTSVQTIMNATGADIGTVNGYFKELDTYADKTVYNLTDMTGAFAKFTNAGVGMDKSVPAIKGIANMVALAGQGAGEASIAMYNLSQSIAGGFLTTTDYKSLNLANVATKEWKDNMIAAGVAAGTLGQNADGTFSILSDGSGKIATSASLFTEELASGWANADILLGVLGQYGDATTEIGKKSLAAAQNVKSLPMMMETLAAAAGTGWTDTFEIVIGNVTESTELFTFLTNQIGGFTDASTEARNSQLQLWRDMGGRDAIVEALHNAFEALHSVLGPIGTAWKSVFPPSLGNTLANLSFFIRDLTKGMILSESAQKNLQMVATGLFSVLKFGVDIVGGILKVFGFLIGLAFDLAGAIFSIVGPILTFVRSLMPVKEGAEEATSSVSGFFDMLIAGGKFLTGWIVNGIKVLGELLNNFLNGGEAVGRIKEMQLWLASLAATVAMVYNVLAKGDFTGGGFFAEDSKFVDVLFNIREGIMTVIDAFQSFGDAVGGAAANAAGFWAGVGGAVKAAWNFIKPVVDSIGKFFSDIMSGMDIETALAAVNTGVLIALAVGIGKVIKKISDSMSFVGDFKKGLLDGLNGLTGVLEGYQKKLKAEALLKIATAIAILAASLWVLSTIDPNRLVSSVTAMATAFGILLGGLAILDKINAEPSIKASVALSLIAASVNILASAVAKMGALKPEQLMNGLVGVAVSIALLVGALAVLDTLNSDNLMKSSFALTVLASALTIMAGAVALFGIMPMDMLIQGFIGVTAALSLLVGAAVLISKFAPQMVLSAVGLMAMAVALNLLVAPITLLGLLPMNVLIQGFVALTAMLVLLTGAAIALSFLAPTMILSAVGMIAMAVAINMLVAPLTILGAIPFEVLVQGLFALAAVMAVLVVAAMAMTGAAVGAAGMIAMSAAILLLSVALAVLAGIGLDGITVAIVGLVAALLVMAGASALLTPLIPIMGAVAGVMALFALGALALAAAVVVLALGMMLMGPALIIATGGLLTFSQVADKIMAAVPAFLAIGAGLLVFGAGALVAGAGIAVFGAGLILLGAGMALVGAVGLIATTALTQFVLGIGKLAGEMPNMLAMGGVFTVLGAGVAVLGAGLLLLGAGALLTGVALLTLVPLGAMVTISINMIVKAIERLAPMTDQIGAISASLGKLGSATTKLADNGNQAAGGLMMLSLQFALLSTGAAMAGTSVAAMASKVGPSITSMITAIQKGPAAFQAFSTAVITSMTVLNSGLTAGANQAQATAARLGQAVGGQMVGGIQGSYGSVYGASVTLGEQMTAGMNRGLQNGSGSVSAMASRVAQTALNAAKKTLGVASPSKEFAKVGAWADEGLVNGMSKNISIVENVGTRVGNAALSATQEALRGLKDRVATDVDLSPTIRPVLDLTDVKKNSTLISGLLTAPSLKVSDSYAVASSLASQQRTNAEEISLSKDGDNPGPSTTFIQNNYSPKALTEAEIYRNTKNLISVTKEENPT